MESDDTHVAMVTPQEKKIITRLEYFLSKFNPKKHELRLPENPMEWIPIVQLMEPCMVKEITEDITEVAEALKKSPNGYFEVSEDKMMIRLNDSPVERMTSISDTRDYKIVYVRGFKNVSHKRIREFLSPFGPEHIGISYRKEDDDREKKPLVVLRFKTKKEADEFSKKNLSFKGRELLLEPQWCKIERKNHLRTDSERILRTIRPYVELGPEAAPVVEERAETDEEENASAEGISSGELARAVSSITEEADDEPEDDGLVLKRGETIDDYLGSGVEEVTVIILPP